MDNPDLPCAAVKVQALDAYGFTWLVKTVGSLHELDPDGLSRILQTIKWKRNSCGRAKEVGSYGNELTGAL